MDARRRLAAVCMSALIASGVLGMSAAQAEKADRGKPINLEADRVTVDDAKQIATFTGNVVLTQGTMVMRGDRMEVRQDKAGFRQGTMWGNLAYFRQKRDGVDELIEGWAERVEYDGRTEKVQMFNRAMLKRGQDEVRGSYISYDVNTEFFQVDGGTRSATSKPGEGRVKVVIQPKPREAPPAAPVPLRPDTGEAQRGETSVGGK